MLTYAHRIPSVDPTTWNLIERRRGRHTDNAQFNGNRYIRGVRSASVRSAAAQPIAKYVYKACRAYEPTYITALPSASALVLVVADRVGRTLSKAITVAVLVLTARTRGVLPSPLSTPLDTGALRSTSKMARCLSLPVCHILNTDTPYMRARAYTPHLYCESHESHHRTPHTRKTVTPRV
ncbi:hypothetical protein DAEQUDRAFT_195896 [Daedalea quercina L-15889]|uniref:Uncharacterized protein n=1 Tax=Daedalea quercina L-15889 TaxID=1314783 RepID=A0A165U7E6_9APHY|nr:hypothetical protein DAEQUDRAFT_195896 [Daedalea quercina L-15889]